MFPSQNGWTPPPPPASDSESEWCVCVRACVRVSAVFPAMGSVLAFRTNGWHPQVGGKMSCGWQGSEVRGHIEDELWMTGVTGHIVSGPDHLGKTFPVLVFTTMSSSAVAVHPLTKANAAWRDCWSPVTKINTLMCSLSVRDLLVDLWVTPWGQVTLSLVKWWRPTHVPHMKYGRCVCQVGSVWNDALSSFKGTPSIKMTEIDPSHVKETSFTCSLVINWIQKSCL